MNLLDRGVGLVRRLLEGARDLLGGLLGRGGGLLRHLLESARGLLRGLLGRGGGLLGDVVASWAAAAADPLVVFASRAAAFAS